MIDPDWCYESPDDAAHTIDKLEREMSDDEEAAEDYVSERQAEGDANETHDL